MQKFLALRPRSRAVGAWLAALLMSGALALSLTPSAHAGPLLLRYAHGYSVQRAYGRTWLCYGWPDGSYHCTQWWHRSNGTLVSDNPGWVPNVAAVAVMPLAQAEQQQGQLDQPAPAASVVAPAPAAAAPGGLSGAVAHLPGAGNTATYPWGWCTWGAAALAWRDLSGLGNARHWAESAARRGIPTGDVPRVGATVVYAPGVQGASWLGHVAHVEQVFSDGRFLVVEMNYYGYGGGFGRYSQRISWPGPGVTFIY